MKYDMDMMKADLQTGEFEQRGPCPCPNVELIDHGDDSGSCVGDCPPYVKYSEMLAHSRKVGIEPNWFIMCSKNEDGKDMLYHQVVYENQPQQEDINSLYLELATDEEFGLQDIVNELTFYVVSREEFEKYNPNTAAPI